MKRKPRKTFKLGKKCHICKKPICDKFYLCEGCWQNKHEDKIFGVIDPLTRAYLYRVDRES